MRSINKYLCILCSFSALSVVKNLNHTCPARLSHAGGLPERQCRQGEHRVVAEKTEIYFRKIFRSLVSLFLLGSFCYRCSDIIREPVRPNIILILADDMGYSDPGCFGSEIHTPNLDRLAAEGLRMTQFYNASRCCPTRASLLTGLYQHQAGVGDMVSDFGIPAYQGFLNKNCVTLAEVLKLNGYNTYMSGKWHVGGKEDQWPGKRGFDRFFGLIDGATNYYKLVPYRYGEEPPKMALDDKRFYPPDSGFYITNAFTEYALNFLDEQKPGEEPFFLYLAFTAPHWPLHALPEDITKYRGTYMIGWDSIREGRYRKMIQSGIIDSSWLLSPRHEEEVPAWNTLDQEEKDMWDLRMSVYAAMIDRMDKNIGKLLDRLAEIKEDGNTLIIFISDNGGCHERIKNRGNYLPTSGITGYPDSFDSYEFNWANVSNTPFRWFKHWVHEGGISSPCIIWYPRMIEAGRIEDRPAHIIDIMPTFIELAGGKYPETYSDQPIKPMMGRSLVPLLRNEDIEWERILFWEHEGNRAVRKGDWKLVSRYDQSEGEFTPWELYNLAEDRTELNDVSKKLPDKTLELIDLYDRMAKAAEVTSWTEVLKTREQNR